MIPSARSHSQHCRECKRAFEYILETVAREPVIKNKNFRWPAGPDEQADLGKDASLFLRHVYECLLARARAELGPELATLVSAPRMAPVDYFLPEHRAIVEFDERQHFTIARKLSLQLYKDAPIHSQVNFDVARWIALCDIHQMRDVNPPHRDWQRAWLDTLRDVRAAHAGGMNPIRRVYAGDAIWCRIAINSAEEQQRVRTFLHGIQ